METATNRKRKSEALSKEEFKKFKAYVKSFSTKTDCLEALNTTMPTLNRILIAGTGRPDSIKKIRNAIKDEDKKEK